VIERASSNDTNAFSAISLLEVVIEPRDRAIIMLYLQVGLTCSEVVWLRVVDVTLPERIQSEADDVGYVQVKRRRGIEHLPLNWKVCEALGSVDISHNMSF
jgi:hypothetical protein